MDSRPGFGSAFIAHQSYLTKSGQAFPSRMSPTMKPTCARVLLPLLTLGFPLGVVLVVVLRLPVEELALASTDMRLLQGFSTFWCGWQEVTSTHPFLAYKVPGDPPVQQTDTHINSFAFRFTLAKGRSHILRYHLLPGSSIDASGCASVGPAEVHVVGDEENEIWCWSKNSGEDISEDTSEELESSETSGSRFRGRSHRRCPSPLVSSHLEVQDNPDSTPSCQSQYSHSLNITKSGLFYVIVRSRHESVNRILLYVRLNRSSYELPDNMILCRSQSRCEIPLAFGSTERVVVFMSAEPDAGSVVFPVRSRCKPRVVFYLVVFLVLPVLFGIALAFAVRTARRNRVLAPPPQASVATVPLLDREPVKPRLQLTPPPPYRLVSELPPPYDAAVTSVKTNST